MLVRHAFLPWEPPVWLKAYLHFFTDVPERRSYWVIRLSAQPAEDVGLRSALGQPQTICARCLDKLGDAQLTAFIRAR